MREVGHTDRGYREIPRQMRESWTHRERIQRETETGERELDRERIQRETETDERELESERER